MGIILFQGCVRFPNAPDFSLRFDLFWRPSTVLKLYKVSFLLIRMRLFVKGRPIHRFLLLGGFCHRFDGGSFFAQFVFDDVEGEELVFRRLEVGVLLDLLIPCKNAQRLGA